MTRNQIKSWFLVRGENRTTPVKTSRRREGNQQTQPTYSIEDRIKDGIKPRAQWWEDCAFNTASCITLLYQYWKGHLIPYWNTFMLPRFSSTPCKDHSHESYIPSDMHLCYLSSVAIYLLSVAIYYLCQFIYYQLDQLLCFRTEAYHLGDRLLFRTIVSLHFSLVWLLSFVSWP